MESTWVRRSLVPNRMNDRENGIGQPEPLCRFFASALHLPWKVTVFPCVYHSLPFASNGNILTHSQCFRFAIISEATACHNHKGPIITLKETGRSDLKIVQLHLEEYDSELAHDVFSSQDRSVFLSFASCCLLFLSIWRVSILFTCSVRCVFLNLSTIYWIVVHTVNFYYEVGSCIQ